MNYSTVIGASHLLLLVIFVFRCSNRNEVKSTHSGAEATDWNLVWADEFDGVKLDSTRWSFQNGDGCDINLCGWGNNELQWYTPDNARVEDGELIIRAVDDSTQPHRYTSAKLRSIGKGDWTYGKFEIRAALPTGQGFWPAIWMMPSENHYGSWASSGEIDIMEALGHQPDRVYGTLHYGDRWPDNTLSGDTLFFDDSSIADYHVYTTEWEEGEIRWFVDGGLYGTQTEWYSEGGEYPAPFDRDFYLIINLAVGGDWPGNPDATTEFPKEMKIDYVRVYQQR